MLSWSYYAVFFLIVTLFQALLPEMYVRVVENGFSALVDDFKGGTFLVLGFVVPTILAINKTRWMWLVGRCWTTWRRCGSSC